MALMEHVAERLHVDVAVEADRPREIPLVLQLAAALDAGGVPYCQWTGRLKSARWAAGVGDVDLLVDRTAAGAFAAVLDSLGFKLALEQPHRRSPGVLSYLGNDPWLGRLIHVHAHFRLIIGDAPHARFRLPIERAVLDSAVQRRCFRTPAPELELALFVLSSTLHHRERAALRRGPPQWLRTAARELPLLEEEADPAEALGALSRILPDIDAVCFDRCLAALRHDASPWQRLAARYALERRLSVYTVRSLPGRTMDAASATVGRAGLSFGRTDNGKRLASGGLVLALCGADGSGMTTCARALHAWLSPELSTRTAHLGQPPRSLLTRAVGLLHRLFRWIDQKRSRTFPSAATLHTELLGYLCLARDRFHIQRSMRLAASAGAIAICERYPLAANNALMGPSSAQGVAISLDTRLARLLRRREESYYAHIAPPDLILVLRVDPETAVDRKPTEPSAVVRARASLLWNADWSGPDTVVVDAVQPVPDVMAELRSHVWSTL
jgi:thymidylate kinase